MKRLLPILAAGLLAVGCNTSGCLDNQSSIPLAGFYSSATGQQISVSNIQIKGVGAPNDSILAAAGSSMKEVYLPMRSTQNTTAWCFSYTQEGLDSPEYNDTVTFYYDSEPYFASEECGAMYRYRIRRCTTTTHVLDSIGITDSLITNVDVQRIRIYVRTAPAEQ